MQRHILQGKIDPHRIPPRHLKILKGIDDEDETWIAHMLKLSGSDEKGSKMPLGSHDYLNAEHEAWIARMLTLAHESGQETKEKEKPKPKDQFDEALVHDFIHNEGIFRE